MRKKLLFSLLITILLGICIFVIVLLFNKPSVQYVTTKVVYKRYNDGILIADIVEHYEYNKFGKIVFSTEYDHGQLFRETEFKYDNNGNLSEELPSIYDNGVIVSKPYHYYSNYSNGQPLNEREFNEITKRDVYIYNEYDDEGRIIFKKNTDPDGKYSSTISYSYDQDGRLLERIYKDNGNTIIETRYKYVNKDNELVTKYNDSNGNIIEKHQLYEDNLVIKEIFYTNGVLQFYRENEYNSQHLIISQKEYDSIDKLKNYTEYEYDDYNNNVSKKIFNEKGDITEEYYWYWEKLS